MCDMQENKAKGFCCYTLGFGSGVDRAILQRLADEGKGSMLTTTTAAQLTSAFVGLAQDATVMKGIIKAMEDKISSMITHRLVLDFL
jgi:hypothetical protein